MKLCSYFLIPVALAAFVAPASAGIIFGKHPPKPDPAELVPELVDTVKNSQDEKKRETAVEDLRQYDPATFPQIVPALLDVLRNDLKPSVRSEAATSLSKLRPVSQQVGAALEQAMAHDASMRVRVQARSALLFYHWAGYHPSKPLEPPQFQSKEPPLATTGGIDPTGPAPMVPPQYIMRQSPMMLRPGESVPPPLIPPETMGMSGPRAPSVVAPTGPLVPIEAPHLQTPPPSGGPELFPN